MRMNEGDTCGSSYRSARVTFKCGKNHQLVSVSEPQTCKYLFVLATPYVCHNHSMLVYPTLTTELRMEWDEVETMLANGEITRKGYDAHLRKIFQKAGYQLTQTQKEDILNNAELQLEAKRKKEVEFESLAQCSQEFAKLKEELEKLKSEKLYNVDSDHHGDDMDYHHGLMDSMEV